MWNGQIQAHWRPFFEALRESGLEDMENRQQEARRLLRENGVTHNLHGDPEGLNRPWELDPIPLIISSQEWAAIESGLIQRALILQLVLTDLYGDRRLITEGVLPLELVFSLEGLLLPCVRTPQQLVLYAADLVRGRDGRMWVVSDRSQAPSGAGYALENRTVLARVAPALFRACQVRRLSFFFQTLRGRLEAIAPRQQDSHRIAVLTPGPGDETYFEQAYMAAYLGYPLVLGDDLTVRDEQVWLKSIDGLKKVDVLLRHVDDRLCDPLELRSDSSLGVAGLMEAARLGNVSLANSLGSGVLENAGLMAFLPQISRRLLGEELELPSVATWWCGQPTELSYVLENLERLIIKTTYSRPEVQTVLGPRLSHAELATWRQRIAAAPHLYVGQEQVDFSTTPSLLDGRLEPHHAILRSFLVADGDTYAAMPGGLTRTAPAKDHFVADAAVNTVSKDTWILAQEAEQRLSLWLRPERNVMVEADSISLPSHTAENLYWFARYAERAEGAARLLRTVLRMLGERDEFGDMADADCLRLLLRALTQLTSTAPGFLGRGSGARLRRPRRELLSIILERERAGSLSSTLHSLRRTAYSVRDRWSTDTWRVIDDIQEHWAALETQPGVGLERARSDLDQLVTDLAALTGLTMESMTRELGWIVLDIGRRIERGVLLVTVLRATLVPRSDEPVEYLLLESILASKESLITYRRRYRSHLQLQTVLELLLLDETNPRSLNYQLSRLQEHMASLPRKNPAPRLNAEEQMVLEASSRLRNCDPDRLAELTERGTKRQDLELLLRGMEDFLGEIADTLSQNFFSHAQGSRQLAATSPEFV